MIVLPMAGMSSRFTRAGYDLPKYMLDLHGWTVFAHALGSFAAQFESHEFLLICRDVHDTPEFIKAEAAKLGLDQDRLRIVVLDAPTAGQAETVAQGLRQSNADPRGPITIFNIDTFRPGFAFPVAFDVEQVDGYLEVFSAPGDHWSFVRASEDENKVIEVTEKIRISDLCSDGLYHFRRAEVFLSLFAEVENRDPAQLQGGEYYIAPLYNSALQRGLDIRYHTIPAQVLRLCGTPQEYAALKALPSFDPWVT